MSEAAALARIRRGLGLLLALAGLIHQAGTVLMLLQARGKGPLRIAPRIWACLYYGNYLFLTVGSLGYLALQYRAAGVFYYETLVDFLLGFTGFIVILSGSAELLHHHAAPWVALLPGLALIGYGLFLASGRGVRARALAP